MLHENFKKAQFAKNYKYIIDSDNNKVKLNDNRVVHILQGLGPHIVKIIKSIYQRRGLNTRYIKNSTKFKLENSIQLYSGRECLTCISLSSSTCYDIVNNRNKKEISLYYGIDSVGACQSGAWPLVWDVFADRLNEKNSFYSIEPNIGNNYLGRGEIFALEMAMAVILGEIFDESEASLKCLAKDTKSALEIFKEETERVAEKMAKGIIYTQPALKKWAKNMAKIPLRAKIEETPRVMILGGTGIVFIHHQIADYFIEQGIIPKVEEFSMGVQYLEGRFTVRNGLARGVCDPLKQFNRMSILLSVFYPDISIKDIYTALRASIHISTIDYIKKYLRRIMKKSGLLFYKPISYWEIIKESNKLASYSSNIETPVPCGLYVCNIKKGDFDGIIDLCYFGCPPCVNAQTIIKSIANSNNLPFAAIDCENPSISTNQRKLLENVSVQAKRLRMEKNKLIKKFDT